MTPEPTPRLLPDVPFPPYAYVTGRFPHPVSDPAGHSHGVAPERPAPPDPELWQECRPYLRGIDLFNHGYYWEAHEAWEGVWHACGRTGLAADFLKGLIKLAAAGVKARAGRPAGVRSHARRAADLLRTTTARLGPGTRRFMGLPLAELAEAADALARHPETARGEPEALVAVVVPFALRPEPFPEK